MDDDQTLRLLIVPGVSPGRWVSTWRERYRTPIEVVVVPAAEAGGRLLASEGEAAFLRLPLEDEALAVIPLWVEQSVVVLSRENALGLLAELSPADLAEETIVTASDDVLGWRDAPGVPFAGVAPPSTAAEAIELVAAEVGVTVVPASIARAHLRKDVVVVPLIGGPTSQVALAWVPVAGEAPALVEDLVGIVRGRTANSSRGRGERDESERPTSKAKARAAEAKRAQTGGGKPGAARSGVRGRAVGRKPGAARGGAGLRRRSGR